MTVNDVIAKIEKTAPLQLAYSWDNSGFLCGDKNKTVKRVYCTLDTNPYTVNEAAKAGADMILSHHPIMFNGIKRLDYDSPHGRVIKTLIEKGIALYAAHTSMDTAAGGLNDVLAQKLDLTGTEVIEKNAAYLGCGLGRVGRTERTTLEAFAKKVCRRLKTPFVRIAGDPKAPVEIAAVGSGACDDLIPAAIEMHADVLVTADMKYHITMDAVESGLCIIDAGHFPTEMFVTEIFEDCLRGEDIEIIKSSESDIFGCCTEKHGIIM